MVSCFDICPYFCFAIQGYDRLQYTIQAFLLLHGIVACNSFHCNYNNPVSPQRLYETH